MVTFTITIEEIKPGMLSLDFAPSDKSQGSELEVLAGEVFYRAINHAADVIMANAPQAQAVEGVFLTDEWKAAFIDKLKKNE
jgi:hypothetical protein